MSIFIYFFRFRSEVYILKLELNTAGPVNNIVLVRQRLYPKSQTSSRRHGPLFPPLEKYANSTDEDTDTKTVIGFQETYNKSMNATYLSSHVIDNQIKELQVLFLRFTFFCSFCSLIYMHRMSSFVHVVLSLLTFQVMDLLQVIKNALLDAPETFL